MTYKQYIQSAEWRKKRHEFLTEHLKYLKCSCCKTFLVYRKDRIHVHHKTYRNFANEKMKDLSALCFDCHIKVHILNRFHKIELYRCHFILRRIIRKSKKLEMMKKGLRVCSSSKFKSTLKIIKIIEKQIYPFRKILPS